MVLCGVECVQNIAKYLNVPVKKIHTSENNVSNLKIKVMCWLINKQYYS